MPRRSRTYYQIFSVAERHYAKRPEGSWEEACPRSDGTSALVADVFDSGTKNPTALSAFTQNTLGIPTTAFSYAGLCQPYTPTDTHKLLQQSAGLLSQYLPRRGDHVVVPVGVSGGGVVTLCGVAQWIEGSELPPKVLRHALPCVVLVAPGFRPAQEIYEQYAEHGEVPSSLDQLCNKRNSRQYLATQRDIVQALALIEWAGIPVHVLYWKPDPVAQFPWRHHTMRVAQHVIKEVPLAPEGLALLPNSDPDFQTHALQAHKDFCTHPQTVKSVRQIVLAAVDLFEAASCGQ